MTVVTGGAPGIDTLAHNWACDLDVDRVVFHANWGKYRPENPRAKNPAGPIRNRAMAEYADALIAIYRGPRPTPGTRSMLQIAQANGLKIYEHVV